VTALLQLAALQQEAGSIASVGQLFTLNISLFNCAATVSSVFVFVFGFANAAHVR
jgi:hypothetical protein